MRNAEKGRNSLPQGRANQFLTQQQSVLKTSIWVIYTDQAGYIWNILVYNKKEVMNF